MSDFTDFKKRILELPPKRLALLALELHEQLERERSARAEPIAVVGMACRFPGGSNSPEEYWALLDAGRDAITEAPPERWDVDALYDPDPDAPGKVATRFGGFVDDVQRFDAGFFSISPREARAMDPQQRLLLETCWRAFEDAGIPPSRYYGQKAGVFVGICGNDYLVRLLKEGPESMDLYLSSGNAYSVAAGRLSFTLGFQGPAFAVDTACSSSLVALHEACSSLRNGESSFAVAAGVNVMCSVETTMALSRSHMMAPDGRCKTFDDAADGFVRAEGCGVVLLKRLSDAVRDGDRIHALLRGSAVNQDGRSTGLTVPNGPAQEQVIREAIARSGLQPDDIDYIEAHGTGTSLGDPIEIRALGRVFGASRDVPLYVGSVKTNFGHLESAAGIAGVIKTILSIEAGRIPPHLHFRTPSRHIEWDQCAIRVPAEGVAWPATDRPRRAGVSSFGFSGTNAHVIVEQAPLSTTLAAQPARPAELLPFSGFTTTARDQLTGDFAQALDALPPAGFADFCHTARAGRAHLGYRRALVAAGPAEARETLLGRGEATLYESPTRCGDAPGIVFLFTGQGAQHPGMGRSLYEHAPAFRAAIDRCAAILDPLMKRPLRDVLFTPGGNDAPIYETAVAQPAVVAFEYALAELWRAWGIQPAAVLGHSLGEYVAATVAGVLRLEEMLPLVHERGRLLASLPGGQRMAAVFASEATLTPLLAAHPGTHVACFNAPENTVISGDAAAVDALLGVCGARGIEHRVLRLDQAFHSPGVEPVMDALERAAATVEHRPSQLPIAWNVTGSMTEGASSGAYWRRHARQSVRFTQGVRALAEQGFRHFLEVGPHPTLSPLITQAIEDAVVVPSLRRGGDAWRDMMDATAQLYVHGATPDWRAIDDGRAYVRTDVPVHPFAGERYWIETDGVLRASAPRGAVPGMRLSAALPIFETVFTPAQPAFLDQHRFRGSALVPGPLFAELGRAAARAAGYAADEVVNLEVATAAIVPEAGLRLQTVLVPDDGNVAFRVLSAPSGDDAAQWTEHATGRVRASASPHPDLARLEERSWRNVDVPGHLALLRELGFELGAEAALYETLEVSDAGARARLRVASHGTVPEVASALAIDAALQVLGAAVAAQQPGQSRMLTAIERITISGRVDDAVTCEAAVRDGARGSTVVGDVVLRDARHHIVASASGVELGRVAPARGGADAWFHALEWRPAERDVAFDAEDVARASAEVERAWRTVATAASLPDYVAWLPGLRQRVAWHVWRALRRLGLSEEVDPRGCDAVAVRLGVASRHHRLFGRLLAMLGEAGVLLRADFAEPVMPRAPRGGESVIELVERCGAALADVLTGAADPLALLFPQGAPDVTRAIYRETPFGRAFNDTVTATVRGLAGAHDAPVRVLEIGAGSGSTTEAVLAALGDRRIEYLFTDVSPTLVARAEESLGGRDGLRFGVLDIERDPADQEFASGSVDLVVAANVLHATMDVRAAIARAATLLRPGGALLLVDGTLREPWVDITFGLTDGWWRFTDTALRPDYPLLSREQWRAVLADAGFEDVLALPMDALATEAGQMVLLGRLPAMAAGETAADVLVLDARRATDPAGVLDEMRRIATAPAAGRLWVVTQNAQAAQPGDRPDPEGAVLWGLGRTFALEHPDRWGGLVDLEADTPDEIARTQIAAAVAAPAEDQVAYRRGRRLCARLVPAAAPAREAFAVGGGAYLITGGLGGLGLMVARWLADAGAERVVLVGRNASPELWRADDRRHDLLQTLRDTGVDVRLRSADLTDRQAAAALVEELRADEAVPLRGIVHAAAVFDNAPIVDLDRTRLDRVVAPKAKAAMLLAKLTTGVALDFFVMFSSTTALLGVAGLGSYAAANQYLDALAVRLRADGVPAVSVNWGLWEEMRLADASDATRYAQGGLLQMNSDAALDALGRVIRNGTPSAIVAHVDWTRLRAMYEARRARPLLAELGTPATTRAAIASTERRDSVSLADVAPEKRRDMILEGVEDAVRAVLRMNSGAPLDRLQGFFEMGMDSLMSVELKGRLEKRFGEKLPATLTFNYPTVLAVGEFLEQRFAAKSAPAPVPVAAAPTPAAVAPDGGESRADDEDLSEEALTALLGERLARLEHEGHAR